MSNCFYTFQSCQSDVTENLILFDFETDAELDRIHWKCHTLFKLSEEHPTHGRKSLRIDLYPSDYPGFSSKLDIIDWSIFKALKFDVFNPTKETVTITVRIDDKEEISEYYNRYNKKFVLLPGCNSVKISLDSLITSDSRRVLDLKNIHRLLIFTGYPQQKYTLYLDYVRLTL